jgi:hypothetical protein
LFSSISELKLRGDHLIVVGQLPSEAGTNITIVDLKRGEIQDTIWTWTYAFSPSGRYLAFTTFVARNEPAMSRRALVLVHDLDLDVAHNRLPSAGQPSYENAGIPVFPPANLLQGSYDIFLEPQHNYISDFLWSSDESRLVFIDWIGRERFINLVNLEKGPQKAKLQRKSFDIMAYADYSKIPDYRRRELEEKPTRFTVSSIEWDGPAEGMIRIELQAEEWLPDNLVLELPQKSEEGE